MNGRAASADALQFEHLKPYLARTEPQTPYSEVADALRISEGASATAGNRPEFSTGSSIELDDFPGWKEVPTW